MDAIFSLISPEILVLSLCVALLAGVIKGIVGFSMPMVMISGLGSFLAPDLALAALILPTLVTNAQQALRQGGRAAWASVKRFKVFMLVGLVMLLASAQLVPLMSPELMFLAIGVPVTILATLQLMGWQPRFEGRARERAGWIAGGVAGAIGGVSGVWGAPTVTYLTAIDTPKVEQVRIQGAIYGLGALALALAHVQSGVLRVETAPLSVVLIVPAVVGILIGFRVQDRLDQAKFRRATLIVLVVAGLNLIRRGMFG